MNAPAERAGAAEAVGLRMRFLLIGIGVWLHAADSLVTATIAPSIVDDIGGVAYINWSIALYQVGAIVAGAAAAVLCVHWGIRRVYMSATLVYAVGCVLAALAPNMSVLLMGRFVQGVGGGMLLALCYVAVEAWFPPERWARMFGLVATIWGGGSLLGPLIGGAFSGRHIWRAAFWAFAVQALIVCALAYGGMPASAKREGPTGKWPVLPLVVLTGATLVIAEAGARSGLPGGVLSSLFGCAVGALLLVLAARLDQRALVRLLPRQLLNIRHPIGAGLLMVFALAAGTTGFWAYGPLILKVLFNTRPLITGYILAGEALAWSLATVAVSSTTQQQEVGLIRVGAVAIATGAAGFAVAVPTGSLIGTVGCALLQGAGFGVCWPAIVHRIVHFADPAERSLASASVSNVQRIGYAIGTAAVGIAANMSGLAESVAADAAKTAGIWVFAAFIPVLLLGVWSAWRFTSDSA